MPDGLTIAFWVMAAITVIAAVGVVSVRNLFHAALFLVLSFAGVAGLFVTLEADFLAAVQVLIYAGAIAILTIFAIMLTREASQGNPANRIAGPVLLLAVLFAVGIAFILLSAQWPLSKELPLPETTTAIADALINRYVLAFEVAGVLLLVAMMGAFVMGKE
ncbi:MAG: NADH-quinone oxidoreductase subunit J [Chloroflexi bacterium]|nr:NADH-quinone oxidoreductase subunit J [Chloroflexota bacterium]